jgi:hypothetical protein
MEPGIDQGDRDRILATLMEEWSPLQRELMSRLLHGEDDSLDSTLAADHGTDACDLRRQRSLARARLQEAVRAWANGDP